MTSELLGFAIFAFVMLYIAFAFAAGGLIWWVSEEDENDERRRFK